MSTAPVDGAAAGSSLFSMSRLVLDVVLDVRFRFGRSLLGSGPGELSRRLRCGQRERHLLQALASDRRSWRPTWRMLLCRADFGFGLGVGQSELQARQLLEELLALDRIETIVHPLGDEPLGLAQ